MIFYNSFIILLSISLSDSQTPSLIRGPKLCPCNSVESAFSIGEDVFMSRDQWIWRFKSINQTKDAFRQIDWSFQSINSINKRKRLSF